VGIGEGAGGGEPGRVARDPGEEEGVGRRE